MKLQEIHKGRSGYTAYVLTDESRAQLLEVFPPTYPDVVAHHITWEFGVTESADLPEASDHIRIVGRVDDGKGVEALLVTVSGNSTRPDGGTLHITWSLDRSTGAKPFHSNQVIQNVTAQPASGRVQAKPQFIAAG